MVQCMRVKPVVFAWMLAVGVAASAQTTLHLASVEGSHISAVGSKILQKILPIAGVQVDVQPLPSARATLVARAGRVDGEVARIANFASNYPELIRVEPSYLTFHTVAFGKNKEQLALNKPEALKTYKVGIVRGVQHSENAVSGVADVTRVNNVEQLLSMLEAGRFDIAVDTRASGEFALKRLGFKDISEIGVLGEQDLFLYLHVRHQTLVPVIGKTIKKMKDSGELKQLVRSVEADF